MTAPAFQSGRFRRAAIVLLLWLLPVAAWSLWDYVEARRLSAAVKATASGEPTSPGTAPGSYPFPAPQNSAGVYYEAAALLMDRSTLSEIETALQYGRGDRAKVIARLRAWLDDNREAEGLIEDGTKAEFKGFRLYDNLRWDRLWLVSSLARARLTERLESRDADGAAAALVRQVRITRGMASATPDSLPFAMERALANLEPVLDLKPSGKPLERLQQAIRGNDRDSLLYEDAVKSRALLIESLWNPGSDWYGRPSVAFGTNPLEPIAYFLARPWFAHRVNTEIRRMNVVVARSRAAWPERLKADPVPMPQISASRWRFLDSPADTVAYLQRQRVAAIARMLAQVRSADCVIAIERYRQAHQGALPAALDSLMPQFLERTPVDPFSGASLKFTVQGNRYAVYSIGADFKDDGGTALSAAPRPETGNQARRDLAPDIGFTVTAEPAAQAR